MGRLCGVGHLVTLGVALTRAPCHLALGGEPNRPWRGVHSRLRFKVRYPTGIKCSGTHGGPSLSTSPALNGWGATLGGEAMHVHY